MADLESTSVEMVDVADPSEETGVEEQELADPVSENEPEDDSEEGTAEEESKGKDDTAWANMRRAAKEAEAERDALKMELAELKAEATAKNAVFSELVGDEDWEITAIAEQTGMSEEDVRVRYELEQQRALVEQLQEEKTLKEAEVAMEADLRRIQAIDPHIKSLDELGEGYGKYIEAGLDCESAYWAIKAKEGANTPKPPKVVAGSVKGGSAEKDYYTEAEINSMSSEQLTKNWKKILDSWGKR